MLRVVSAFGELAKKCYLASGTSFKTILRRLDDSSGFWQKWRCKKTGETIMISTPLRRDYIREGKENKKGDRKSVV